jgi:uncharacterized membrane protein YraQ (UPF0718 family)
LLQSCPYYPKAVYQQERPVDQPIQAMPLILPVGLALALVLALVLALALVLVLALALALVLALVLELVLAEIWQYNDQNWPQQHKLPVSELKQAESLQGFQH